MMATATTELFGSARRAALNHSLSERGTRHTPQLITTQAFADWLMLALYASGIIVLMFHTWEGGNVAQIAQPFGVVLMIAAGALAWVYGFKFESPAPFELCLVAMWLLSLIMLFLNNEVSPESSRLSLVVSLILLCTVVGNAALIRRFPMERLLKVLAIALALSIVPVFAVEFDGIVLALTSDADRWRYRLAPLGLHPSQASIIFSLGLLLSIHRIVLGKMLEKVTYAALLIPHAMIVMATGGRTGVLSCAISLLLVFVMRMRSTPPIVWFGLVFAILGSVWYFEQLFSYFSNIFELNSETRGWGSGATGRTETWRRGFELMFADPVRLLFGSGLRTAGVEEIGFNPENSYILIVLESGGILLVAFLVTMFATIVRLHYHATDPDKDTRLILYGILPLVQYALFAGFFYRQLLSVGNPASMIFIIVFAGAWTYLSQSKTAPKSIRNAALSAQDAETDRHALRRRKAAADAVANVPILSSPAIRRRARAQGASITSS